MYSIYILLCLRRRSVTQESCSKLRFEKQKLGDVCIALDVNTVTFVKMDPNYFGQHCVIELTLLKDPSNLLLDNATHGPLV